MPVSRISITIPSALVSATDRRARELDRSRSWVVADAYTTGLGDYRLARLKADLDLTPEQRVREAEQTAREAELAAGRRRIDQVLSFDRYEDYLDWKRHRDIGR